MLFNRELNEFIDKTGVSFYGFSCVEDELPENLKVLKNAVTIGVKLNSFIMSQVKDKPTFTYFHHYRTVNTFLDQTGLKISMFLEKNGYQSLQVAASQSIKDGPDEYMGIFPHKTAAVKAGLGWIGRNALFISNDFGPGVRMATILTDAPLDVYIGEIPEAGKCGDCYACVHACPAMAVKGELWVRGEARSRILDAKACSEYMNKNFKHIGRGSVCGLCITSCRYWR